MVNVVIVETGNSGEGPNVEEAIRDAIGVQNYPIDLIAQGQGIYAVLWERPRTDRQLKRTAVVRPVDWDRDIPAGH